MIEKYGLRCDDCHLSGRFVPVNQLKGAIHFAPVGDVLFRDTAKRFEHRTRQLSEICERLGGQKESVGDVAYRLPLFDFLPVILQFWDSDEEFEPVLKIMWDENLLEFIHYETSYFALGHLWKRMAELLGEDGAGA